MTGIQPCETCLAKDAGRAVKRAAIATKDGVVKGYQATAEGVQKAYNYSTKLTKAQNFENKTYKALNCSKKWIGNKR